MSDLSAKDQRDARKWLIKMMDRPDLHEEGFTPDSKADPTGETSIFRFTAK